MKKLLRIIEGLLAALGLLFIIIVLLIGNGKYSISITESNVGLYQQRIDTLKAAGGYYPDSIKLCMSSVQDTANARKIMDYFQLDTLYSSNADTWTKAVAIAEFVARNIPHNNQKIQPERKNAIALWEYTKTIEPAFNCRLHSILLYELMTAAGLRASFVSCMPQDKEDNDCHVVNQVWLPEKSKWAMIDSDMGGNYASNKEGEPLSLAEIRERYIAGEKIFYHPGFGKGSSKINYYYAYMAKNSYWFSCWETLHYDQEPSAGKNVGRYIHLVPDGFEPFGVDEGEIVTSDAQQFWGTGEK